jgi:hypothetical protein
VVSIACFHLSSDNLGNPYNPLGLEAVFYITQMDDSDFMMAKQEVVNKGFAADDIIAYEGCPGDDIILLGGRDGKSVFEQ